MHLVCRRDVVTSQQSTPRLQYRPECWLLSTNFMCLWKTELWISTSWSYCLLLPYSKLAFLWTNSEKEKWVGGEWKRMAGPGLVSKHRGYKRLLHRFPDLDLILRGQSCVCSTEGPLKTLLSLPGLTKPSATDLWGADTLVSALPWRTVSHTHLPGTRCLLPPLYLALRLFS